MGVGFVEIGRPIGEDVVAGPYVAIMHLVIYVQVAESGKGQ